MIRVLHVLGRARVTYFFEGLVRHAEGRRFDVTACTLEGRGALHEGLQRLGVESFALGCERRAGFPLAVARLARLLRRRRVDVVHTHLFDPSLVGQLAAVLAGTPLRVMTRWHSDLHAVLGRPVHAWVDRVTARLAHRVIAISEYTRTVLTDLEGLPAERVRVIYPAFREFPAADRVAIDERERLVAELGLAGHVVIGTVARLHPVKDHRTLFEAMATVIGHQPRVKLLVIGEGPLREALVAQAHALGIAGATLFLGFREDVERLYDVMDVLVHPALEEAFGIVIPEAMAKGIAVVCTPRGIAAEVVEDGRNGLVVPVGQAAAMADAIGRLVVSAELRQLLGQAARDSVQGRFSLPTVTRAYEACYDDALAARDGPGRSSTAAHSTVGDHR